MGSVAVNGQCTSLGQNPGTAFPVCGTSKFQQKDVPLCGGRFIPSPCGANEGLSDVNPFWYKFTAFSDGTLGFVITPQVLSDDYDWQVFDITGKDPNDVYTDPSLFVASNWSGEGGTTGASAAGSSLSVCGGYGKPTYSKMPVLKKGHEYILLISHFTQTQSGYALEFKGGTANITDDTQPALVSARALCDGSTVEVTLNKKMRCTSLAANGSDFQFADPAFSVVSAVSRKCAVGFDMDTILLTTNKALIPGTYKLSVKKGSDGNSLLDYCNTPMPSDEEISFTVNPIQPTPFDSIVPLECAPTFLEFVFENEILCNSVDPAGSDFRITGPTPVNIRGVEVNCTSQKTRRIKLNLDMPITVGGSYNVTLQTGTDGNTLIDVCTQETPAGSTIPFNLKDTVDADFTIDMQLNCDVDIVNFSHNGSNGVNSYNWSFDQSVARSEASPRISYRQQGNHSAFLKVSNGFCSDSLTKTFLLPEKLNASFTSSEIVCPNEAAEFVDNTTGPVSTWAWDFGNGNTFNGKQPSPQLYHANGREHEETIRLIVSDGNCTDTAFAKIIVVTSCMIAVPSAFTPNGDGKNDFLYPSNAYKAEDLRFLVYNRYGQVVYESNDWRKRWDGRLNGGEAPAGTYVWSLIYTLRSTGKKHTYKGTTLLVR